MLRKMSFDQKIFVLRIYLFLNDIIDNKVTKSIMLSVECTGPDTAQV